MQKALSLYIDNLMFEKNRLALLNQLEVEKNKAQFLLDELHFPLPHQLTTDGVIFDLQSLSSVSSLKHSKLPLDFFESSYIQTCPYYYAKLLFDDLKENLEKLKDYLKKL